MRPAEMEHLQAVTALSQIRIEHPSWVEAHTEILDLHALRAARQEGSGILILGESGAGKTALLRAIAARFPRREEPDRTVVPCLLTGIPPRATIKTVGQTILSALGDPLAFVDGQNAAKTTHRVVTLLAGCRTELILIDELAHLMDGRWNDSLASVADWLKDLADATHAPLVLAGLPRCEGILQANEQLRRRFAASISLHVVSPDRSGTDLTTFRAVVREVERCLPIPEGSHLYSADTARRLLFATDGRMGYLMALISRAVRLCQRMDRAVIGLEILEAAFRRAIWRSAVGSRNPFSTEFNWQRLTGAGEPFAPCDSAIPRRGRK